MIVVFVSGCNFKTIEGDITILCDSHGITVESCTIINTRRQWCRCFEITVAVSDE